MNASADSAPGLAPHGRDIGELPMYQAAARIAQSGYKGLPVVDADDRVVGMLTETDFLRRLKAGTFLELMLRLIAEAGQFSHRCHDTQVREVMTTPAQVVGDAANESYLVELCSGEQRYWQYLGEDECAAVWWRDIESGRSFTEASLMYAWRIVRKQNES